NAVHRPMRSIPIFIGQSHIVSDTVMLVPVAFRERRLDTSDGYDDQAPVHDPYLVPISEAQRKATAAILEALMAMANDELETTKDAFTTTGAPSLRHSARGSGSNEGPDVVMMLISGFVLVGLIFVIGIFLSLLR
ncbi:hypothetical protein PENTCL1PPCAC_7216, partial [Pristionchus entomophagus]